MIRRCLCLVGLCFGPMALAAPPQNKALAKDLYLGEAYYQAAQGNYFDAIGRLDTELWQFYRLDDPKLDPLHYQVNQANFSVGDFELSYRMHQRAGRAMKAVLEGNVDEAIRNEAAWRLARILMQKGDVSAALTTVEKIKGRIPEKIRAEEQLLRGQVYLHAGRFAEAIKTFEGLKSEKGFEGFAAYNLGIAFVLSGQEATGFDQLAKAGSLPADDEANLAIKDKANLLLGSRLIASGRPGEAKQYLDRVRISGPFSTRALLSSGWADAAEGKFDSALVPWSTLIQRNSTDKAVQEGLLGAPYAYSKLTLHGRAATLYATALQTFGTELGKLDASLKSIREGRFRAALVRDEAKLDSNWVVKLRELPDAPETHYLLELMASDDFQESLQNYFDLEQLRRRLVAWSESLDSFAEIIELRGRYYGTELPGVDKRFKELDSQMRLRIEQRRTLHERLQQLLVAPRPDFLQTADERMVRERLGQLSERYQNDTSAAGQDLRRRIVRLQGVLHFEIHTTYNSRLTSAYKHLHELDADVERLNAIHGSFVRSRQAATQSYKGYDKQLGALRRKVREAQDKVATLMARQGHVLEAMAVQELDQRRARLEDYQVQARFALAESYDKANKDQEGGTK
ncbi:MAG TPA: tetratricopeptide repeat protein [Burkholderiaceae bacterium]|nr:tetratricopeptide repeat protein [Burkholderiaceae bacterium]